MLVQLIKFERSLFKIDSIFFRSVFFSLIIMNVYVFNLCWSSYRRIDKMTSIKQTSPRLSCCVSMFKNNLQNTRSFFQRHHRIKFNKFSNSWWAVENYWINIVEVWHENVIYDEYICVKIECRFIAFKTHISSMAYDSFEKKVFSEQKLMLNLYFCDSFSERAL